MDTNQFRELVRKFSQCGVSIERCYSDRLLVLSYVLTRYLRRKATSALQQYRSCPVLCSYQSDGWSTTVWTRHVVKSGDRVLRNAKMRHEFLLQAGFFKVLDDSHQVFCSYAS